MQFSVCNLRSFPEPVSRFAAVRGARLHYLSQGTGHPVVFLHGNPGSCEDWAGVINLAAEEYLAVAFDRPGHGRSEQVETEDLGVEGQASLIEAAVADLGLRLPILVGHSWGGALALACAVRYPGKWRGLVLLAPAAYESGDSGLFWSNLAALPLIGVAGSFLLSRLIAPGLIERELKRAFAPEPVPAEYLTTALETWTTLNRVRAFTRDDVSLDRSLRALASHYSTIKAPVVIVTGDSDLVTPAPENAYRLHRELPASELVVLKGAGHEIQITHPGAVLDAVERVLATVGSE